MKIKFSHEGFIPLERYAHGTKILILMDWADDDVWIELYEIAGKRGNKRLLKFDEKTGNDVPVENEDFCGWEPLEFGLKTPDDGYSITFESLFSPRLRKKITKRIEEAKEKE